MKIEQLINESVFELMEELDIILSDYELNLVAPEDLGEYQESQQDGNIATIYGCVYYSIEDAVRNALYKILNNYKIKE